MLPLKIYIGGLSRTIFCLQKTMKNKLISMILIIMVLATMLIGCSKETTADNSVADSGAASSETTEATKAPEVTEAASEQNTTPEITEAPSESDNTPEVTQTPVVAEPVDMKIAVMTGPTAMGMAQVMENAEKNTALNNYTFEVYGTPDEITTKLIKGELDAACVPCNLASVLNNKSEGEIIVCAINTLGVLYIVETGETVTSVADLAGKDIYATGQGSTPEYTLRYMLSQNGIDPDKDVNIIFLSEASEVAAAIAEKDNAIAMLPQPYVTVAGLQNEKLRVALDVTEEWEKTTADSTVVTGVLVARKSFVNENKVAFENLLTEYRASVDYVNANNAEAAELIEHFGIFKAAVAKKALPYCNVTFISGSEMKEKISGYLQVLYDQNPKAVGGKLPGDDFYY